MSIKEVLIAAEVAAKSGDVGRAIALYRQILMQVPKHSKAKKALSRLEKQSAAVQMTQADANALMTVLNRGDFDVAYDMAQAFSRKFSNEPFVFNILGYICGTLGKNKEAITAYKWAIKLNPNFVEAMSNYGSFLVQIGRMDDAVEVLRKAILKRPDYAEAHHNLGVVYAGQDNADLAITHYNKAISLNPRYANALHSRGKLYLAQSNHRAAQEDLTLALQLAPQDNLIKSGLMTAFLGLEQTDEALTLAQELTISEPDNVEYLRQYAVQLNTLGRVQDAIAVFDRILEKDPNHAEALGFSVRLQTGARQDVLINHIQSLLGKYDLPDEDIVQMAFDLGQSLEKRGAYEESATCLKQGNAAQKRLLPPPPETDDEKFARITGLFDPQILPNLRAGADPSETPIFVVGLMRSGTSLAEQILASHSKVYGAGELMAATEFSKDIYDKGRKATHMDVQAFAQKYLADVQHRSGGATKVVDKMPDNFFNVGLLRIAFPNAKIIATVRDPRDTCFSIYKNHFDTNAHQYAYDQADLARFANNYQRMMNMWHDLFPGEIYSLRYEDMVADQEGETKRLLDYLGLDWEDNVLDFHKTKRAVRTASVNQVRQKIYSSSVKSWQNYKPYLTELLDGLDQGLWAHAFVE